MPSKCSIFSAGDQCRQPGGRSATRGMYGKAMTLPSSRRTPSLRCRFNGEPAIGSLCGGRLALGQAQPSRVRACDNLALLPNTTPIKSRAVAAGRNFPVPLGRASVGCGAELAFEFFEDRGAVALAASCAVETAIEVRFDADREDDPPHLQPHRKAEWVEVGHRP